MPELLSSFCVDVRAGPFTVILLSHSWNKLHGCKLDKFLVYAPGTEGGEVMMKSILRELGLCPYTATEYQHAFKPYNKSNENSKTELKWVLIPMTSSNTNAETSKNEHPGTHCPTPSNEGAGEKMSKSELHHSDNLKQFVDLQSSHLGTKLAHAFTRIREFHPDQPVAFVGMDSPELPIDEIYHAVKFVSQARQKAYMNPAQDGGYGMLCIPACAPLNVFEGVRWSSSLTSVSQMKALSDNGIDTVLGSLMNDIDEVEDVINLANRLIANHLKSKHLLLTTNNRTSDECRGNGVFDSSFDRLLRCSEVLLNHNGYNEKFACNLYRQPSLCPITFMALLKLGVVKETLAKEGYVLCIQDNNTPNK
jgi:hypothetical protein